MSALQTRTGLGILLALTGGLLISIDIPVIRLAQSDPWLVMFMRGFGMMSVLGLLMLFGKNLTDTPPDPFRDKQWVEVGILYSMTSVFFALAVFSTSTANLVFILAFNPMAAAIFAWILIGEKPDIVTWIAIGLTMLGVSVIVSDGLTGGTLTGDLFALAAAVTLAFGLVRTRQSGKDMSLTPVFAGMLNCLFALPMVILYSSFPGVPVWLGVNVIIIAPMAGFVFSLAPRFIPAPQVAMFFLLETVLAPIWTWMIFAEIPSDQTLVGGAIVLLAIAAHSAWQLTKGAKSRRLRAATA